MSSSKKKQKQSEKSKETPVINEKVKEKTLKNKKAWIIIVTILVICTSALAAYGIHTLTPKHKFLKAISSKPTTIRQAAICGNLDIVKYNFVTANEKSSTKTVNLNNSGINYNGEFDFNSKKMLLQINVNYNQKQYPIIVYMTDKQIILDAQGYIDMYQINVPEKEKVKVPKYIYTSKVDEMNIKQFWDKLENILNTKKSANSKTEEKLSYLTINSIPEKYFSKQDSGWLYLSFDRLGLQEIMRYIVQETWHEDELFARTISELASNIDQEKGFPAQKPVTLEEALQKTNQTWNNIDGFIKLNKFSLGINNNKTNFRNCFEIDCSIEKSKDFPAGGDIVLNGENEITIKQEVNIKIPALNEQNSILLNDISL